MASKSYIAARARKTRQDRSAGGQKGMASRWAGHTKKLTPAQRRQRLRKIERADELRALAVKLHTIDGLTYQQIADQLKITKGAVAWAMNKVGAKRRRVGRPANRYRCPAKKRDGSPCTEKVREKGARCWIHNRGRATP